jgi:hypothetical protein
MSPFEAARKLLDADSQKMTLGAKADLVFQVSASLLFLCPSVPQTYAHIIWLQRPLS